MAMVVEYRHDQSVLARRAEARAGGDGQAVRVRLLLLAHGYEDW